MQELPKTPGFYCHFLRACCLPGLFSRLWGLWGLIVNRSDCQLRAALLFFSPKQLLQISHHLSLALKRIQNQTSSSRKNCPLTELGLSGRFNFSIVCTRRRQELQQLGLWQLSPYQIMSTTVKGSGYICTCSACRDR